jgi:DNA-binding CsgD family transcriptional regulator
MVPKNRDELSAREIEVLRLVARGCSDANIGELLFIATHTASNHVGRILDKLGATNRAEAVMIALSTGIIRTPPPPN